MACSGRDVDSVMLRRGGGETQRQVRFGDTKWPEQLSATVFWGANGRLDGRPSHFPSSRSIDNLPRMTPAGLEPATYGLKERMLIGFLTSLSIGKPAPGLAIHPKLYSARIY